MSETELSTEKWESVRSRIMTLHEVAEKVANNDPEFINSVSGYTVTSLSHISKGLHGSEISMKTYGADADVPHINMIPHPNIADTLFNTQNEYIAQSKDEFFAGLADNDRVLTGKYWAFQERLLQSGVPSDKARRYYGDVFNVVGRDHYQDRSELVKLALKSNIVNELQHLGIPNLGFDEIVDMIYESKDRCGVLVIYKNKDNLKRIAQQDGYEFADDTTLVLYNDIPDELICAIVPLGEYEKKQMGVLT